MSQRAAIANEVAPTWEDFSAECHGELPEPAPADPFTLTDEDLIDFTRTRRREVVDLAWPCSVPVPSWRVLWHVSCVPDGQPDCNELESQTPLCASAGWRVGALPGVLAALRPPWGSTPPRLEPRGGSAGPGRRLEEQEEKNDEGCVLPLVDVHDRATFTAAPTLRGTVERRSARYASSTGGGPRQEAARSEGAAAAERAKESQRLWDLAVPERNWDIRHPFLPALLLGILGMQPGPSAAPRPRPRRARRGMPNVPRPSSQSAEHDGSRRGAAAAEALPRRGAAAAEAPPARRRGCRGGAAAAEARLPRRRGCAAAAEAPQPRRRRS
ncbi:unnamed protein product [Prorocentrum cordatum]|uniref:Uncharacterized protein n=1 Tax=Prorocentrum cordatum TaxID=2364126 RepID=A0ABN9WQT7_9DINO|nr:unnamed protein product [Polarella glacialis]